MASTMPEERKNWKQEPLVWLLIAIPAAAVVMGVVMITLAIQTYSGLVVDDYYKKGKQINRVIARDQLAYELGLAAAVRFGDEGKIEVRFAPGVDFVPEGNIEFRLVHATKPGLDQALVLERSDTSLLTGTLKLKGEGRWNLYLQTSDWRLVGSLQYPRQKAADMLPNYIPGQ